MGMTLEGEESVSKYKMHVQMQSQSHMHLRLLSFYVLNFVQGRVIHWAEIFVDFDFEFHNVAQMPWQF